MAEGRGLGSGRAMLPGDRDQAGGGRGERGLFRVATSADSSRHASGEQGGRVGDGCVP